MVTAYKSKQPLPVALSIAGLDPSGGAGVIADARAFIAFGCSPAFAITSITFQNDKALLGAEHLSAETIRGQVMAVLAGANVASVKTGMLPTKEAVREVTRLLRQADLPAPVVDPVIRSSSGYSLIEDDALEELLRELLPLARLVTPNIAEAEQITGLKIKNVEDMYQAASVIRGSGSRAVLIKGGHLGPLAGAHASGRSNVVQNSSEMDHSSPTAVDLLDNEGQITLFRGEWIEGGQLRGTGCLLSSAIAAGLARGKSLEQSVGEAKTFVASAIRDATSRAQ
jgi:hydroxymethylpyrimidine/phosphomethylpyrimidine kinase